jgi:integrase
MVKATFRLSRKIGSDDKAQIIVKLTINRSNRPCFKSKVFIKPSWFKPVQIAGKGSYFDIIPPKKGRFNYMEVKEANKAKAQLDSFVIHLSAICNALAGHPNELNHDFIEKAETLTNDVPATEITRKVIEEAITMKESEEAKRGKTFFDWANLYFDSYVNLKGNKITQSSKNKYKCLFRMLARYEKFVRATDKERKDFTLDIDTFNKDTINDFFDYMEDEPKLAEKYPNIFQKMLVDSPINNTTRKQVIKQRGKNSVIERKKELKTFFNWLNMQGYTNNRPFIGVNIGTAKYGTPYFLTLEERDKIADFDIKSRWEAMTKSERKNLRSALSTILTQRDIFIFHCMIGCRVSDLITLTPESLVNGMVHYIPIKTKDEKPNVTSVPVNKKAQALIDRYKGIDKKGRLFPFISTQKYNDALKDIFYLCGIDRIIDKLNPVTGEEEKHPLYEVASSHIARRTFIGDFYDKVQDPNLIGSMTGHVEGSKAFARYRNIDDDLKKEVIHRID